MVGIPQIDLSWLKPKPQEVDLSWLKPPTESIAKQEEPDLSWLTPPQESAPPITTEQAPTQPWEAQYGVRTKEHPQGPVTLKDVAQAARYTAGQFVAFPASVATTIGMLPFHKPSEAEAIGAKVGRAITGTPSTPGAQQLTRGLNAVPETILGPIGEGISLAAKTAFPKNKEGQAVVRVGLGASLLLYSFAKGAVKELIESRVKAGMDITPKELLSIIEKTPEAPPEVVTEAIGRVTKTTAPPAEAPILTNPEPQPPPFVPEVPYAPDIKAGERPTQGVLPMPDAAPLFQGTKTPIEVSSHAGEGGWSPEALRRNKSFFVVDTRTNRQRPIPGVDAVDYTPAPTEIKYQRDRQTGKIELVSAGEIAAKKKDILYYSPYEISGGKAGQPKGRLVLPGEATPGPVAGQTVTPPPLIPGKTGTQARNVPEAGKPFFGRESTADYLSRLNKEPSLPASLAKGPEGDIVKSVVGTGEPRSLDEAITRATERPPLEFKQSAAGGMVSPNLARFKTTAARVVQRLYDQFSNPDRTSPIGPRDAGDKWWGARSGGGALGDWLKNDLRTIFGTNPKRMDMAYTYMTDPKYFAEKFPGIDPKSVFTLEQLDAFNGLRFMGDKLFAFDNEMGVLDNYIEDYAPQIMMGKATGEKGPARPISWMSLPEKSRFFKERPLPDERTVDINNSTYRKINSQTPLTPDEAAFVKEYGYPQQELTILKDIPSIFSSYVGSHYRTFANRQLLSDMKSLTLPVEVRPGTVVDAPAVLPPSAAIFKENSVYFQQNWHPLDIEPFRSWIIKEAGGETTVLEGPVYVHPKVYQVLKNIMDVSKEDVPGALGKVRQGYLSARGNLKRLIVMNPLIHGTNVLSGAVVEGGWDFLADFIKARKLLKSRSAEVLNGAFDGLDFRTAKHVGSELAEGMKQQAERLEPRTGLGAAAHVPLDVLGTAKAASDKFLWEKIVQTGQMVVYMAEKSKMMEKGFPVDRAGKMGAVMANNIMGTIPYYWMEKSVRNSASAVLFARDWTFSNWDMIRNALNNKWGFDKAGMTAAESRAVSNAYRIHLAKGFGQMLVFNGFMSYLMNGINNNDWEPKNLTPLGRDWRNALDIDTGKTDKYGRRVYLAGWGWRYLRDIAGLPLGVGEGNMFQTFINKMEPLMKQTIEQVTNMSLWSGQKIVPRGAPFLEELGTRVQHAVGMLPIKQYTGLMAGPKKPEPADLAMALTGTWVRHGNAPGSITKQVQNVGAQRQVDLRAIRDRIINLVVDGKRKEAFELARQYYSNAATTIAGIELQIHSPEAYALKQLPTKQRLAFLKTLDPEKRKKLNQDMNRKSWGPK